MYRIRFRRSAQDRVLGGVCGGAGACLGISSWWIRAVFAVLLLTNYAFALLLYALLWLSVPPQRMVDLPPIARPDEPRPRLCSSPEGVLTLGGLAIAAGVVVLAETSGVLRLSGGGNLLAPLMLALIGLSLLLKAPRNAP
ncbi:MAG: PspC domain-containing protein [Chloroflexi bacterium]|nr:PspC domain-containing protein [Chloroflexota bacterium]